MRANREQDNAVKLRDDIDQVLKETSDMQEQAANRCDDAFNSRIAEYKDARNDGQQSLAKVILLAAS